MAWPVDRRTFLQRSIGASGVAGATSDATRTDQSGSSAAAVDPAGATPLSIFDVRTFGARADASTVDTGAFVGAIEAAHRASGGIVYVPPGDYVTGTIRLLSHVTLYLEAGSRILASTNQSDYQQGCLIVADEAINVGLTGRGAVDGRGPAFWKRKADGTWTSADWRPSELVRFTRCDNLLIEDLTLRNSPNWTIHAIDCDRVIIRGISVVNGINEDDGPNTDGVMIDGCAKTTISDCFIQGGDDCIVLKCMQSRSQVCRDVTVTNCVLLTSESALKIGSDTYGEFHNITFSNCAVRDAGCGIGLWMRDGGLVDGWRISNISMTLTGGGQPIFFWSHRRTDETPWGIVRNVSISDVTATADGGIFLSGVPDRWLESISLENVRLHMRGAAGQKLHEDPPFPFPIWDHRRSPYDIFCRYVRNLTLRNIHLTRGEPEQARWGGAIRCHDVDGLDIDGFVGRQAAGATDAVIRLRRVRGAFIRNCRAPEGTGAFVDMGDGVERLSIMNNDLGRARLVVQRTDAGGERAALFEFGNRPPAG